MTGTAAAGLSVRSAADGKGVTGADQDRVPRRVAPPMAHFAGMASANMPEAPFVLIGALINGKGSGRAFKWRIRRNKPFCRFFENIDMISKIPGKRE